MSTAREPLGQLQALVTGAVQGALMKASTPAGPFAIEVEPGMDEDGYTNTIRVRGRESGERVVIRVEREEER